MRVPSPTGVGEKWRWPVLGSVPEGGRLPGASREQERVRAVLASPQPLFRDRDALAWIHADAASIPVSEETIRRLHALTRGQIWNAGLFEDRDADIIERYADGGERVRFQTVSAAQTPGAIARLLTDWRTCMEERWVLPPIALAAFNLDFLCIHPFRDGNGRVSRLNERAGPGFRIRELEQACPGVSLDMVRRVLREEQRAGRVECQGKGPAVVWRGKG